MKLLLAILIFISFNSEIFSQPKIFHVRTDGDDSNNGLSWTAPFAAVQKESDSADSLDQIWIATGTYHPTSANGLIAKEIGSNVDQERLKHFRMKNGVTIYSNASGDIREGGGFTAINSIIEDHLFVCGEINPDHPFLIYGNSPALDAGSNELLPEGILYDIRGEPRIVRGKVEIGTDVLTFNQLIPDEGLIDIGLSLKDGEGYTGEGELLRLTLNHEYRDGSHIRFSLEDISASNENGLPLAFDSNPFEYVIGQREVTRLARGFILKRWRTL